MSDSLISSVSANRSKDKTREEIEAETGLSRREQETARKHLRAAALLREERRDVPARLYYLIHVERLNATWEAFLANGFPP